MPPRGALNCFHSGLSVVVLLPHDDIREVQLQVYTVSPCPSPPMKYMFPSWSVECIPQHGAGRGSTELHWSPSNNSTTFNFQPPEPPPATTKTSGDLVLTDDVLERLVGIGGSDACHCSPVSLVNSRLVHSKVEGRRPPTATNMDW